MSVIKLFAGANLTLTATITGEDLSSATIEFDAIPINGGAAVIDLDDGDPQISGDSEGVVKAELGTDDTDLDAGWYYAQFKVTKGGGVQFIPDEGGFIVLRIFESVF